MPIAADYRMVDAAFDSIHAEEGAGAWESMVENFTSRSTMEIPDLSEALDSVFGILEVGSLEPNNA